MTDEVKKEQTLEKVSLRKGMSGVWRHLRSHKKLMIVLSILGLFSAIANAAVPYVTGRFFDALIHLSSGQISLGTYPLWVTLLVIWTFVQIIANGTDWAKDRVRRTFELKLRFEIETHAFSHFLRLPLSYYTNANISGELNKVTMTAWRITAIMRILVDILPQFLGVIIGVILAISINTTLAGVLALGVLVYVLMIIPMLIPIAAADHAAHTSWNDVYNDATEPINQALTVKQATAEEYEMKKTREGYFGKIFPNWMKLEYTWSNISFYQRIVVFLTQLSVFIVSVQYVSNGTLTVGELVALNGYAMMFFGPFVALGYGWQTIQNGLTSAAHLENILLLKEEDYHPTDGAKGGNGTGEVIFNNVEFSYEEGKTDILSDVSFVTTSGQSVALVGESGSGKSTAIALISAYYFPSKGSVIIDGIDTKNWDLLELRKRIAVVPQEVALFNDTIRANIAYGTFDATTDQIEEAAKKAHMDEFIQKLPEKYDTTVGERGIKLSVGQKQRVAIARAILRNPEILILDEPTSALDAETESYITKSLEELMKGRTTFIIAHRLSTVRKADKILVLKEGRIAEEGTHDELLRKEGGVYRHLHDLHIGLRD